MLFTRNFITYLILIFVDLLIIVNVIYAFDIAHILPSVYAGGIASDLDKSYFGIDSLINAFTQYFEANTFLNGWKTFLNGFFKFFNNLSFQSLANMIAPNVQSSFKDALIGLLSFINLFANIVYQFFAIIYGMCLLVYAISIVVNFVIFIVAIASGLFATPLPNTYGLHTCMMTMIAQLPF